MEAGRFFAVSAVLVSAARHPAAQGASLLNSLSGVRPPDDVHPDWAARAAMADAIAATLQTLTVPHA